MKFATNDVLTHYTALMTPKIQQTSHPDTIAMLANPRPKCFEESPTHAMISAPDSRPSVSHLFSSHPPVSRPPVSRSPVSRSPVTVLITNVVAPILFVTLLLAGCGAAPEAPVEVGPVRTAQPTFTPTPPAASALDAAAQADVEPTLDPNTPTTAIVSGALLNVRGGPGTEFDIVAEVTAGETFEVVGVNESGEWWNICCVGEGAGGSGWVTGEFIDIAGPTERFGGASPATEADTEADSAADTEADSAAGSAQTGGPVASDAAPVDENAPIAVVNAPVVNARSGPNTTFEIVAEVERGREFSIIGSNATREWWQVCCVDGEEVWVVDEFVDTQGDLERLDGDAGAAGGEQAGGQATGPAADSASGDFALADSEQFAEPGVVRIYLYVVGDGGALADYSLRVIHNGESLSVNETSFGGQPSFTWPVADARQRFQNLKVEFPGVEPAGTWAVQLVNAGGEVVGPAATFELAENDPRRELYVRYQQQ